MKQNGIIGSGTEKIIIVPKSDTILVVPADVKSIAPPTEPIPIMTYCDVNEYHDYKDGQSLRRERRKRQRKNR